MPLKEPINPMKPLHPGAFPLQAIKHWAEQLRLGGLAKIGWPGIIIVEGRSEGFDPKP